MYKYQPNEEVQTTDENGKLHIQWKKKLPKAEPLQPKKILDKRLIKKNRGKEYYEYLVKWKYHREADATWMTTTLLQKSGEIVEDFMGISP